MEPEEAARIVAALDRLDDRLRMAPPGLHVVGPPASAAACAEVGLTPAAAMLWIRWDGLEIGAETARILPLAEIGEATDRAEADGWLRPGDVVIGEHGRDLLVLAADPYDEGADVVRVEEGGERLPEASTAAHLALGLVAESAVLFDDDGEFRDGLFGDDVEPTAAAWRKLLRRRLDVDPDAPRARLRLAQHLMEAGELRAAASELRQVLRRAPELPWAHETLGRVRLAQGDREGALRAFSAAATAMERFDSATAAWFRAHAALCAEGEQREGIAAQVRRDRPGFAAEQVHAAQALIDRGARGQARDVVTLGLAVSPGQVELLALRDRIDAVEDEQR